jgi:hypothetical protein
MVFDTDCFEYHPEFLAGREADDCLQRLWDELEWTQKEIVLFGRRMMIPFWQTPTGMAGTAWGGTGMMKRNWAGSHVSLH